MDMNEGLNMMEAPNLWETRKKVFYEEQHRELTNRTNMFEAMQEQQTQQAQQTKTEVVRPHFLDSMPYLPSDVSLPGQMATPRKESYLERKKRRNVKKQCDRAYSAEQELIRVEGSAQIRESRRTAVGQSSSAGYKNEQTVLDKQLTLIRAKEDADLASVELLHRQQLDGAAQPSADPAASVPALAAKVRWSAQEMRYDAYHRMAVAMEVGSKVRIEAMKKAEAAKVKADVLKRKYKVACMKPGTEKTRESATISRHQRFDMLKGIFRKPTDYSREDAELSLMIGDQNQEELHLVNVGRATMGGTKAMYEFDDLNGDGMSQRWLYKEATNCIGMSKPSGAVVTGEAYRLQRQLRGELSIPAYCVKVDGQVVGSVQKKMQRAEGGVDLFKWQAQEDLTVDAPDAVTMHDLMNEHTLDWVLCNFDTKGENFINQEGGHVISFDKEASFNKLLDNGSREMSYTYKPHSNDTIYNTMFKAYAEGKIDLDLYANEESIHSIESKDAGQYVEMFKETLDAKYKKGSQRSEAEQLLKNRFQTLRETYRTFYTELIRERIKHFQGDSDAHQQERDRLNAYLDNGTFHFRDERV